MIPNSKILSSIFLIYSLSIFIVEDIYPSSVPIVTNIDEIQDQITVIEAKERGEDLFASRMLPLCDLNGDGFKDIIFSGDYTEEDSITYVLYGREELPLSFDISKYAEWGMRFHAVSHNEERSTFPTGMLGDLDKDGFDDIFFGACFLGETCPGIILFGGPNLPTNLEMSDITSLRHCEVYPSDDVLTDHGNKIFRKTASGDVNGDGIRDVVLSSNTDYLPDGMPEEGLVYLILGSDPWPTKIDLTKLGSEHKGCLIRARNLQLEQSPKFGWNISSGFDYNDDGFDDIIISAPYWTCDEDCSEYGGAMFIVFGREEWPKVLDVGVQLSDEKNVCRIFSSIEYDLLGKYFYPINDITGDNIPDVLLRDSDIGFCIVSGKYFVPGNFLIRDIITTVFRGRPSSPAMGTYIGDWTGDGINDLILGEQDKRDTTIGTGPLGVVYIIEGRTDFPPDVFLDGNMEGLHKIFGPLLTENQSSIFANTVLSGDINGDGLSDIVVNCPRLWGIPQDFIGRLYIIPGGTSLLGPLESDGFSPKASNLEGGNRLVIRGRGFDENTEVFFGDIKLEVIERPDSRILIARVPEVSDPATYQVKLKRETDTFTFEDEFTFFDSIFPYEVDVEELGERGCVITEPADAERFNTGIQHVKGGYDFTGDQLSDVLFAYITDKGLGVSPHEGRVFLLHGSTDLPQKLKTDELDNSATIFVSEEKEDLLGQEAFLVGDMDGDGISELAISAPLSGHIYIVKGGGIPKGEIVIQQLVDENRVYVIKNCPIGVFHEQAWPGVMLFCVDDVNGDGYMDLGIWVEGQPYIDNGRESLIASISFLLGGEEMKDIISFYDLPRCYAKLPPSNAIGDMRIHYPTGIGDVDGDGFDDVTFECWAGTDPELPDSKEYTAEFILFGRRVFEDVTTMDKELEDGRAIEVFERGRCIGDQNQDGIDDLGFFYRNKNPDTRSLHILYGGSREKLAENRDLSNPADFDVVFPSTFPFTKTLFGFSGGRDYNADGFEDILLPDLHSKLPPSRAFVIFGGNLEEKAAPLSEVRDCTQLICNLLAIHGDDYAGFPEGFSFAGDVNGDGYEDLVAMSLLNIIIYFNPLGSIKIGKEFIRGDVNQDIKINIADPILILDFLFGSNKILPCMDSADTNDDERINLADAITLLMYLFVDGDLPPPFFECGPDNEIAPEEDTLDCRDSICP